MDLNKFDGRVPIISSVALHWPLQCRHSSMRFSKQARRKSLNACRELGITARNLVCDALFSVWAEPGWDSGLTLDRRSLKFESKTEHMGVAMSEAPKANYTTWCRDITARHGSWNQVFISNQNDKLNYQNKGKKLGAILQLGKRALCFSSFPVIMAKLKDSKKASCTWSIQHIPWGKLYIQHRCSVQAW